LTGGNRSTEWIGPGCVRPLAGARRAIAVVAAPVLCVLALAAPASASHNDTRATAVTVTSGQNVFHNNIDATPNINQSGGGEYLGPCPYDYGTTVWYEFVAPASGTLTVKAIGGDSWWVDFYPTHRLFDPNVAVFPGSSISAPIGCNDDDPTGPGLNSRVDVRVTSGSAYGIQVGGIALEIEGDSFYDEGYFDLLVDFTADPPPPVLEAELKAPLVVYGDRPGEKEHHMSKIRAFRLITEPGATAELTCRGDCAGIKKGEEEPRALQDGKLNVKAMFGKNTLLAPHTRVELTVTKPGAIGKYFKVTTRAEKPAKRTECRIQLSGERTDCDTG
jgi:hypothetical protein